MMIKFSQWGSKHSYTASGIIFDIGRCCRRAINKFWDRFDYLCNFKEAEIEYRGLRYGGNEAAV